MPANLSQQYYSAEEAYRKAATPEDKLAALEEMLATIPKHKGTEKLQADLKKRLSKLKKEGMSKAKGTSRQEDPFLVEPQGAGQVMLLGWPNAGKSALVGAVTNAKTVVAEFPFSTPLPIPGMMSYQDILIQLVDTPPFMPEGMTGNFMTALRISDMILLVIDASDADAADQLTILLNFLEEKRIVREDAPPGARAVGPERVLILASKMDKDDAQDNLEIIRELVPNCPPILPISAQEGMNLEELKERIFKVLDVIRVYTKKPGKKPEMDTPFVLPTGSNVMGLAEAIHKDIAANLKTAKVWGSSKFDGQLVTYDYILSDGDIVELND
jgi:ribosome-interacting GTPase 1